VSIHEETKMRRIVVGVDGSPASKAALGFALEEARFRQAELTVVHVYRATHPVEARHSEGFEMGVYAPVGYGQTQPSPPDETSRRAAMRRREEDYRREQSRIEAEEGLARELIDAMVGEFAIAAAVKVTPLAIADAHPAEALVEAAADADLLIVGSRGRGGFTGLLLGSVSQQCVSHARSPVVVVPSPR
jgi:nucleotide-binding universal stress UspA family protein